MKRVSRFLERFRLRYVGLYYVLESAQFFFISKMTLLPRSSSSSCFTSFFLWAKSISNVEQISFQFSSFFLLIVLFKLAIHCCLQHLFRPLLFVVVIIDITSRSAVASQSDIQNLPTNAEFNCLGAANCFPGRHFNPSHFLS